MACRQIWDSFCRQPSPRCHIRDEWVGNLLLAWIFEEEMSSRAIGKLSINHCLDHWIHTILVVCWISFPHPLLMWSPIRIPLCARLSAWIMCVCQPFWKRKVKAMHIFSIRELKVCWKKSHFTLGLMLLVAQHWSPFTLLTINLLRAIKRQASLNGYISDWE